MLREARDNAQCEIVVDAIEIQTKERTTASFEDPREYFNPEGEIAWPEGAECPILPIKLADQTVTA